MKLHTHTHTHTHPKTTGVRDDGNATSRTSLASAACVAVICALLACAWTAASADATVSHPFLTSFDGHEVPGGMFVTAGAVAADAANGRLYVADVGSNAIDEFSVEGKFLMQITGTTTPAGGFALTSQGAIAVDNSTNPGDSDKGALYVVDAGNGVIDKFDDTGAYVEQFIPPFVSTVLGIGVDGEGHIWAYDENGDVYELRSSGGEVIFHYNTEKFADGPFTVDSNGNTYPSTFFGVEQYDPQGHLEGFVESCGLCQAAVATDLATDNVYIDRRTSIAQYDSERSTIAEFGEEQLASGGEGGMAVDANTGDIYVANSADKRVYVFGPASGPRAEPQLATNVHARAATVNAEINSRGAATTYQFEYGKTTNYGETAPAAPGAVENGNSPVGVSVTLPGLEGGTTYHYRVVATNINGTATSADRTFTTLPVPVISSAEALEVTSSEAALHATINPHGLETTYRFEWGDSSSYGSRAPVPDGEIGAGEEPVFVAQRIGGLSPGVTYHWRIVATAAGEETDSSDHTFVFAGRSGLPDGRAYEMVTPPHKNGALLGAVFILGVAPIVSADGSRIMASSVQCFDESKSCPVDRGQIGAPYSFTRTPSGWEASALAPSSELFEAASIWQFGATEGDVLLSAPNPVTHEDDFYVRRADGTLSLIGPLTPPGGPSGIGVTATYASTGVRKLVWTNLTGKWPFDKTNSAANATMYELDAGSEQPRLVAVKGGIGSNELIGVCGEIPIPTTGVLSEDGSAIYFIVNSCPEGGVGPSGEPNGEEIPVREFFARINGERTVAISEPETNSACTSVACLANTGPAHKEKFRAAEFVGAAPNGSIAYFTSTQQLTNEATQDERLADSAQGVGGCNGTTGTGCNLYAFECAKCANTSEQKLIDVSAGDVSGAGPRVKGVEAVSQDGSHVYFVSQGVLTSEPNRDGEHAEARRDNLYVYRRDASAQSEAISYIATLPEGDSTCTNSSPATSCEWSAGTDEPANATPDGRFLVFLSRGKLTPDDQSTNGSLQVFRYDSDTGELVRISRGQDGFNDEGNLGSPQECEPGFCSTDARIAPGRVAESLTEPRYDPTMSDNGEYVFFQSPEALTPGALNNVKIGSTGPGLPQYAQNVYEWHNGVVSLISGADVSANNGQSAICNPVLSSVCLLGTDRTGANVFFSTSSSLVPADTDTELDYYDARICTAASPCISSAPASTAGCEGEACHLAASGPPAAGAPASVTAAGQGGLVAPLVAAATPRKKKTAAQVRAEKLAKALKVCKKKKKGKRASCEKQARKLYGRAK
jgi:hypothetical protein